MPVWYPQTLIPIEKNTSLNQNAGTYSILTATGDALVIMFVAKTTTAASGLTSIVIGTNNTSSLSLLGVSLLAALGADKTLAQSGSPFILENGKAVQVTLVGNGTGGNLLCAAAYMPLSTGAFLS